MVTYLILVDKSSSFKENGYKFNWISNKFLFNSSIAYLDYLIQMCTVVKNLKLQRVHFSVINALDYNLTFKGRIVFKKFFE